MEQCRSVGANRTALGLGGKHSEQPNYDIPDTFDKQTGNYYAKIGAPVDLDAFRTAYNFAAGDTRAVYYNNGDLGVARDMHCKTFTGGIIACYVTNYGRDTIPPFKTIFGLDPQTAIGEALNAVQSGPNQPLATVAMVYDPSLAVGGNHVKFMVYDESGVLSRYAPLDTPGLLANLDRFHSSNANITVPDNCLTCHGASSTYTRSETGAASISAAGFLPFDPEALIFSTSNPTYSQANMLIKLKALNALVWDTTPLPAVKELLKGMYPVGTTPTGPKDAASAFSNTYVPAAWASAGEPGIELYNEVVKPYCRTCHITAKTDRDFDSYTEFFNLPGVAENTCGDSGRPMPQAERVQTRFWTSPARAHLVTALDISGACAP